MLELKGKYNTAKVFTDVIDEASMTQIMTLCNQEFVQGSQIRLMPDVHAGAGCTIGTTMHITDKIVPNLVGVDIGCGMETIKVKEKEIDFSELDYLISSKIPAGSCVREHSHPYYGLIQEELYNLCCFRKANINRAEKSLGTLGGGNHFIEVDKDDKGSLYIVIHSGSRRLGLEVARFYQEEGYAKLNGKDYASIKELIQLLKKQGREREIQEAILRTKALNKTEIPKELAYVEGELFEKYIHDMMIVQQFAALNRKAMADEIVKGLKLHVEEQFTTIHNYIDTDNMILRKGAVSAQKDEILLIPINMRDGSLICKGKGNKDWNYSAPHGAGRLMSRAKAKAAFSVEDYARQMEGIYTSSVNKSTLDECPMAYKDMDSIVDNIGDTVEILKVIKPVYNFKAGE